MALQVADRVQVTSVSYTTSSFTLGSALTGFQSFTALTSGNTTYYAATDTVGNWEVGYGTYTSATPALSRTTILSSSNSGSVVTFSGTVNIFITYPAEKAVIQDVNGNISGNSFTPGWTSTTTAAGTTTLTVASSYYQRFVGSTTQTIVLPAANTVALGQGYIIDNDSTGNVTLQDGSLTTITTIVPGMAGFIFCESNSSVAGSWSGYQFVPGAGVSGAVTWGTAGLVMGGSGIDNAVIGANTANTGTFTTITGQTETLKGTGSNLLTYSQLIGGTNWSTVGTATVTTNSSATTDPLGGNTSTLVTNATDLLYNGNCVYRPTITIVSGTTYTLSCYVKFGTATTCGIATRDNSTGSSFSGTTTTATGWTRLSVSITTGASTTAISMEIGGANGTFYAWGAQVEIGSVTNTYVPTTTTAVYGTPTLSFSGVSTIGLQNDGALFVQPAGTGALQAQQTTSTATGGNARGANAVDWQTSRTAATMVASAQAVIAGGQNNTASGTASSALGGYTNLVNANYATAVGGSYGTTRGVIGLVSIPASNQPLNVTTAGSTQSSMLVIGVQTTNATATALKSNTSAASATNQLVLPNGQTSTVSVYTFRVLVSAHNTGTTDAAGWEIKGVISRGATAANTALVGTPSVALLGATTGAITAGWGTVSNVATVADTTNGALQIQVTGAASTTINWSATIETNELGY